MKAAIIAAIVAAVVAAGTAGATTLPNYHSNRPSGRSAFACANGGSCQVWVVTVVVPTAPTGGGGCGGGNSCSQTFTFLEATKTAALNEASVLLAEYPSQPVTVQESQTS